MIINLHDREGIERECAILAHELVQRAEEGAPSAIHTAKLARRIAALAETLAR